MSERVSPPQDRFSEVEGEVPASWYLDLKVQHDRFKLALDDAQKIVEDYADGNLDSLVALGKIGHRILKATDE